MRAGFFALLTLAAVASAHNKVTHFHVNGVADTKCVRQATSTDPITDLAGKEMACNAVSQTTASKCEVQAGDEVAFEYRSEPNKAPEQVALKDGSIKVGVTDDSHKGPCTVYAKKVSDSATAEGAGDGWFKISQDGVKDGEFCTTRLNNADAPVKATIPKSLAPGDYLLRAEILTLNNAAPDGEREPQFYPGCVQVTISGGDSTAKPATVAIPGYLNIDSPGLLYNIWTKEDYSDYEIPGPAPLAESSTDTPATETPDSESTPETEEPDNESTPETEESEVVPIPVPELTFSSDTAKPTTTHTVPLFTDIVSLPTASPLLPSPTLLPIPTAEVAYPSFSSNPFPPVSSPVDQATTIVTATSTHTPVGTAGTGAPAAPTQVRGYKWNYGKNYGGKPRGRFGARRYGGN